MKRYKRPVTIEHETATGLNRLMMTKRRSWCSYGAADLAGVGRMQYPANIRVVRIPCTGRMDPKFALTALREGADAVWVSG